MTRDTDLSYGFPTDCLAYSGESRAHVNWIGKKVAGSYKEVDAAPELI
jgi:hypothetical protein